MINTLYAVFSEAEQILQLSSMNMEEKTLVIMG